MAGIIVFESLAQALRAGYQVYDNLIENGHRIGYVVRTRTPGGWGMAHVRMR
jgi:hypothetical protein